MKLLTQMPGPGPRGDHDGLDAFHALGMFVGLVLAVVALVLVAMLVWNSFKVRGELRALRGEVARLGGGPDAVVPGTAPGGASAGAPGRLAPAAPAGVNHGVLAVPPAPPVYVAAPPPYVAAPPAPPAAPAPPAPPTPPTPPGPPAPPVAKAPVAKAPVAKAPVAKAPVAKAPRAPRKKPTDAGE